MQLCSKHGCSQLLSEISSVWNCFVVANFPAQVPFVVPVHGYLPGFDGTHDQIHTDLLEHYAEEMGRGAGA